MTENDNSSLDRELPPPTEKYCFIIMPIADHPDYPQNHFDRVYKHLITPACEKAGLVPYRADDNKASDMIMVDILQKLVECDMAICDISSRNANVFFELGLRQAFNKKTILITDGSQIPPFDISVLRHTTYSPSLRVDTVEDEIKKIADMLTETEKLSNDKVNSIIQLLQIKPAKLDQKTLPPMDSVIFKMFNDLKEQISELKMTNGDANFHSRENKQNIPYPFESNFGSYSVPPGFNFNTINTDDNRMVLNKWKYLNKEPGENLKRNIIGKFIGTDNNNLAFQDHGLIKLIDDTPENRKRIISI